RILEESSLLVEEMRHSATFLPVIESGSKLSRALSAVDRRLVRARPTFFGYQFVMVLRPMNLESVTG
ncbi:MAG TPA: hypothetical protein PKL71_11020, partial [Marmoricola sp.]|nr:hypothetical protein [Marmoricola sp.]